jgi:dihydrolipoamide dehydrogenase
MPVEIRVPYLGHNVEKASVIRWLKAEGQSLKEKEVIVELEAEKAVMEIESPAQGTLAGIYTPEGSQVKPGDLMGIVAVAGETVAIAKPLLERREPAADRATVSSPTELTGPPKRIVIIGGGPGGYTAAIKAAQGGAAVTLVEKARLGGTCLHTGCMPTKAYLSKAKILEQLSASKLFSGSEGVHLDMKKLMVAKDSAVGDLTNGLALLMKRYRIEVANGTATLSGPKKVSIQPLGEEPFEIEADAVIIAAGSAPVDIPGVEVDGSLIHNTDTIWGLDNVPKRMLIAGSGAVGVEFACIYNVLGAKVTLVEILEQAMPGLDREIAAELAKSLKARGIELLTATGIMKARKKGSRVYATLGNGGSGKERAFDCLLIATGRRPDIGGLGLETAGVATHRGAINVGPDMRTSAADVYAIGDVIGPPMLAHAAFHEADVAVANIFGSSLRTDYRKIPYCIYSYPEVGSIGWTEEQARKQNPRCKTARFPFNANGKAMVCGETEGMVKLIFDDDLGEILGVHIIGEHATELIANFSTALSAELTIDEVAAAVMAHPTLSEAMAEAARAALGHALHI